MAARSERLSLIDTAWLRMEQPTNLMMIGGLSVVDGSLDVARLGGVFQRRLAGVYPRFRQRIVSDGIGPPRWRDDPLFDVREHVHRVALPAPGDDETLRELVSELMSTPLDPTRPLWDTHVIEGLAGGRTAVLSRLHHCLGDGTALVRALLDITDTSPAMHHRARHIRHRAAPSTAARIAHLLDPRTTASGGLTAVAQALALTRLVLLWPDPATALRGGLGRRKQVAWTRPIALAEMKRLREVEGCSVNDVLVSAITGALRHQLAAHDHGRIPERVRAMVPVDLRDVGSDHGMTNYFGLVFLDLPVGIADAMQRLAEVHSRMQRALHSPEPTVSLEVLGVLGLGPRVVQRLATLFFGSKATAVVTNVRGPRRPLYLTGRRILSQTFFVPQSAGLGLGISIYSYGGEIRVAVIADAHCVPDPRTLARAVEEELERLIHPGDGPVALLMGRPVPLRKRRATAASGARRRS